MRPVHSEHARPVPMFMFYGHKTSTMLTAAPLSPAARTFYQTPRRSVAGRQTFKPVIFAQKREHKIPRGPELVPCNLVCPGTEIKYQFKLYI